MRLRPLLITAAAALASCGSPDSQPTQEFAATDMRPEPETQPGAGDTVINPFGENAVMGNDAGTGEDMTAADDAGRTMTGGSETGDDIDPALLPAGPLTAARSCSDGKRVCADMEDCGDAVFHLEQCGMSRLDGDSDGTPCEKICG